MRPDVDKKPSLLWNGYGYKAYHGFYSVVVTLIPTAGDEYIAGSYDRDTLSFLSIAGKSASGDTLCALISNLNSPYTSISAVFSNIPWSGETVVEQYTVRGPDKRFEPNIGVKNCANGSLSHNMTDVASPSVILLKLYKSFVTESRSSRHWIRPDARVKYCIVGRTLIVSMPYVGIKRVDLFSPSGRILHSAYTCKNELSIDCFAFGAGLYLLQVNGAVFRLYLKN